MEVIEEKLGVLMDDLERKFSFNTDFFESILSDEMPVSDVNATVNIPGVGDFDLKLLDVKYLVDGVTYFRPFIRGFIVLLLAIWNVQQFLGFIKQDSGVYTSGGGDGKVNIEVRSNKK